MSEHCREQMPFYIEGGLSPDERDSIEAHLRECDSCRAELDQWRALAEAVRLRAQRSAASLPPMKLPASHLNSMNNRPAQSRKGVKVVYNSAMVKSQLMPKMRLPGVTLVATFVMMIFAALLVLRISQPSTSSSTTAPTPMQDQTIYEILQHDSRFSLYAELVGYSDWITSILDGDEPVTLFVMTDDDLWPVLNRLGGLPRMAGHTWEEALLFSHMVNGTWTLEELRSINFVPGEWERAGLGHYRIGVTVDTDEQGEINLNADTDTMPVNILEGDMIASNGVIHVVDRTLVADDVFSTEIGIRFAAKVGDQDAVCGQTYENVGASESQIEITDLRFYVSNVRLINNAEEEVPLTLTQDNLWQYQNLALLDFEDGSAQCRDTGNEPLNDQVIGSIPAGDYSGIMFDVGIPFELNHLDSTTAPSPLNVGAMWWYWQDGYKFVRVDLLVNDNIWIFHLGSTGCTAFDFNIAPRKPCRNPNVATIRLDDFNFETDVIIADIGTLLANLDMTQSTEPGCMSENGDADCRSVFPVFGLTPSAQPPCSGDACVAQSFFRISE